jgi:hypothetical protein
MPGEKKHFEVLICSYSEQIDPASKSRLRALLLVQGRDLCKLFAALRAWSAACPFCDRRYFWAESSYYEACKFTVSDLGRCPVLAIDRRRGASLPELIAGAIDAAH